MPLKLFDPLLFQKTVNDNLATKPGAQANYQQSYAQWMQPILDDPVTLERYYRYYYQLQKNVDEQMMTVLQTLLSSRFKDDTVVFFSPTMATFSVRIGIIRNGIPHTKRRSGCH